MPGARFFFLSHALSFVLLPSPRLFEGVLAALLGCLAPVQYVRVIARNGHLADASGRLRMYFGIRLGVQRCLERELSPSRKANPSKGGDAKPTGLPRREVAGLPNNGGDLRRSALRERERADVTSHQPSPPKTVASLISAIAQCGWR
jgi:hypothetical protein